MCSSDRSFHVCDRISLASSFVLFVISLLIFNKVIVAPSTVSPRRVSLDSRTRQLLWTVSCARISLVQPATVA